MHFSHMCTNDLRPTKLLEELCGKEEVPLLQYLAINGYVQRLLFFFIINNQKLISK